MKRRLFTAMMVIVMAAFMLAGCGSKGETIANPVTDTTKDGITQETGIDMDAPGGAESPVYAYIKMEGADSIGQVIFTLDGKEYCYRAQKSSLESLMGEADAEEGTMIQSLTAAVENGAAVSGMYYEWEGTAISNRGGIPAITVLNEGKEGFTAWLDTEKGIIYSLSMDDDASQELLESVAMQCR